MIVHNTLAKTVSTMMLHQSPCFHDLSKKRFGRWTAIAAVHITLSSGRNVVGWRCQCDCGNEKIIHAIHLKKGLSRSCGCLAKELTVKRQTIHGASRTKIYGVWSAMLARCYNKNVFGFPWYGARGIKVCKRWHTFANFLADMGLPPPSMSLDRIDNDGDYKPSNCRWATPSQQAANSRKRRKKKKSSD